MTRIWHTDYKWKLQEPVKILGVVTPKIMVLLLVK